MLKIYCTECGAGVEYLSNKPKFCSSCGNPFDKKVALPVLKPKRTISKIEDEDVEEIEDSDTEESESSSVPEIDNLEYDISIPQKSKETIGNLIGTYTPESDLHLPDIERKQVSREEFLENFAKEAGSLRGITRKKNGPKN